MNIYLITFNAFDYDQYDSFVVSAKTKKSVIKILKEIYPVEDYFSGVDWGGGFTITKLNPKKEEIILSSFNAG